MTGNSFQGAPRGLSETHSIDLISKDIYDKIEFNYPNLSDYNEKCNIKFSNKNDDKVKEICKKSLRYLEKSYVWDIPNPGYDPCTVLNYWIYNKLTHILGDKSTSDIAFGTFQLQWNLPMSNRSNITYSQKCKLNFDMLNNEDWEKRKELYDYYVDYSTLFSTANNYVTKCKEYYKYIEGKAPLYKNFENLCTSNSSNCPQIYDKCMSYNPDLVLKTIKCHEQIVAERAAKPSASHHSSGEKLISGPSAPGTESIQEHSQIGTKVGHSFLGVAPVLLTATALYRYTPIGSWIRKLGETNLNSISDMNGFSSYTQESGDIFSDRVENYISYQPM
ncbi:PIR Superfamily Protein [Plasmodium ovale wallikeri]|uniref:PIR Superfamily Protein n=2 Tax=Plasmodium ovale TaxID=36330 RepID=A0A1A9AFX3_PLAOA|nr:PIR Superfamily Protein [Plasmodium ovale wallikeri]SBT57707.1 PIR Superfamily Protein [Plasmodium ovale wallikeri]SBT73747.1 PIR protein [Plasmodium ovale]